MAKTKPKPKPKPKQKTHLISESANAVTNIRKPAYSFKRLMAK